MGFIFDRMGDMEKYKQIYIDAVNNHFKEKPTGKGTTHTVMSASRAELNFNAL